MTRVVIVVIGFALLLWCALWFGHSEPSLHRCRCLEGTEQQWQCKVQCGERSP